MAASNRVRIQVLGTIGESWVTVDDLQPYLKDVASRTIRPSADADPEQEKIASSWAAALERLSRNADLKMKKEIAQEFGVSVRTVDRRLARFRHNPTPEGQVDSLRGPAQGSRRLSLRIETIIDEAYEDVYLRRESPRVSDFHEAIKARCCKNGLTSPSRRAVEARLLSRDPMRALVRRRGCDLAEALQKPSTTGLKVSRPLEVVQIDHALVDVIVVSENTRQEIGRPWITLAIDVYSRAIVGWFLSLDVPNQTSVGLCLEHACFPKRDYLRDLGLSIDYTVYGKPEAFHWDNAWSFQAKGIQIQCQRRGISTIVRPVKKPHWGAYVERYIGTLMGKVHLLRGTTFSNTSQRKGYDSQKRAVMSMSELKKWIAIEITQRYFNDNHRGLEQRAPGAVWGAYFKGSNGSSNLPAVMADRKGFLIGFLPFALRKITREGVGLFDLDYWDPALTPLINHPDRFRVYYRQDNLSRIWLFHANEYLEIPLLDRSIPAFSHRELKQAKKELKEDPKAAYHRNEVANAVLAKRALEDEAATKSRVARKSRECRPESSPTGVRCVDYGKPATRLNPLLIRVK
ncbi:Mu transposase C-terminal domain-containing protein [Xanthomonas campestris]|uniref:Mu transposase C-terminal domain-containing protein n=1 Tax=Xanthomonas campestris pv. papavericola TaxID=487881 RepID=A0AAJ2X5M1_XANCA|nr:Mu transposase C-terminal domain-containing protein [Xanthomonas campestris]MEC3889830.1 Mu transposase C-terminal domain-containing protein [Xanthomonas campestris pv. papavericola]